MNINMLRFIVLLLITLSGCSVAKDLQKTPLIVPDLFRSATLQSDSASIGEILWKDFYTDETLRNLIDSALVNNYDMQVALNKIESAQVLLSQVKWNNVPQITFNGTASSSRPSDNSVTGLSIKQFGLGSRHIEDYSANLSLSWEADIWGKIRNQKKAALAAYLKTWEVRKLIQTDLIAGIARGYYNLLMLDFQLDIARRNVSLNDSTLSMVKLQYQAGQVTLLAVQQTEAQLQAAVQLVPEFEQYMTIQENALKILAGRLPDKVQRNATLLKINTVTNLSTGIPSVIVGRRPDVKAAELSLNISNANVGINKANLYPALRISASGGINAFKASDWFNVPASLFGIVSGSVVQPILNQKRLRSQYKLTQIEREQSVLVFRQSVLNAVGEISDALVSIEKLKLQSRIANERVNTLKKATSNASLLFKNGLANYLEVITAQGNVLQGELELAALKGAELNAVSNLYRSLGGGWK
jgi:NodT family efflux transporter outer membrane factor (OMF) lipoprotein